MLDEIFRIIEARRPGVYDQFVRYAVVGASVTALDFALYLWLTRGTAMFSGRFVLAATVSFLCAVAVSFTLNNFWTFRQDLAGWHRRAPKFLTVAVTGLCLNALILHLIILAGAHDILAKIISTALVTGWNFSMHKLWTFRA